jgi:hypothetical protein
MSTSVLPQLLEVDSELSVQASALESQLNELREKRKGVQTVIAMFESGVAPQLEESAIPASQGTGKSTISKSTGKSTEKSTEKSTAKTTGKTTGKTAGKTAVPKVAKVAKTVKGAEAAKEKSTKTVAKVKAVKAPKEVAKATKEKTTEKTTEKATAKVKATRGRPAKASAKATKALTVKKPAVSKRSGRTANWQRYVQDSYSKAPLPDVIVGVLQAQPNNIFKIADVMSAVFKEDMPKNHFLKARNRVSNILSAGARDGDWFRGRGGTYSVSEKAIKAVG